MESMLVLPSLPCFLMQCDNKLLHSRAHWIKRKFSFQGSKSEYRGLDFKIMNIKFKHKKCVQEQNHDKFAIRGRMLY